MVTNFLVTVAEKFAKFLGKFENHHSKVTLMWLFLGNYCKNWATYCANIRHTVN